MFLKHRCVYRKEGSYYRKTMKDKKEDILYKIQVLKALDEDINENKKIDIKDGYGKTRHKIRKQSGKLYIWKTFNRIAAMLAIPLLLSTLILSYMQLKQGETLSAVTHMEVVAAPGTVIKTQLPDQSEVWLNGGSALRYPSRFGDDKRTVELTGEAFFEVKTNPNHPFEVDISSGMKIIAKGTAFNISAYPDDVRYEATLQQGVIDVVLGQKTISLLPNEMVAYDKNAGVLHKSTINIDEKTGWKEGRLIFRNTPLDEVFRRLSRRYNVDFDVHKSADADYGIWATFTTENIPQILDVLKMAAPIKWSIREMEQQNDLSYSRQRIDVWIK